MTEKEQLWYLINGVLNDKPFPSTLFLNPSTQPAAVRRPQPSGRSPVNPIKKEPLCGPFSGIIEKREGKV